MMNYSRYAAKQRLLVHLADEKTVIAVIDRRRVDPAAGEHHATPMRSARLDCNTRGLSRGRQGDTAEADIDRRISSIEERFELDRKWAIVRKYPGACLYSVGKIGRLPRP